jgi:hypothetical protein
MVADSAAEVTQPKNKWMAKTKKEGDSEPMKNMCGEDCALGELFETSAR